jgi:hypothetical protein
MPLWLWLFKQKKSSLWELENELRHMEPGHLSNQVTNIDIHPMDFWTGDTSLIEFFIPDTETTLKIANTALDPEDPLDDQFTWARQMKDDGDIIHQELHYELYRSFVNYMRHSPGGKKVPCFWKLVS